MQAQAFTTDQVADATGMPAPTLRRLTELGVLKPGKRQAKGPGTSNLFSFNQMLGVAVVKQLRVPSEGDARLQVMKFFGSGRGNELVERVEAEASDDVFVIDGEGELHVERGSSLARKITNGWDEFHGLHLHRLIIKLRHRLSTSRLPSPKGRSGRAPRRSIDEKLLSEVEKTMLRAKDK